MAVLLGWHLQQPALAVSYSVIDIGTLGGSVTLPAAINDHGQVVGSGRPAGDPFSEFLGARIYFYHAFLYSGGAMTDIHVYGGDSEASDINNNGQVVGTYGPGGSLPRAYSYAFLYDNGTMTDLHGSLDSRFLSCGANAINDSGQIAGRATPTSLITNAIIFQGATAKDLGSISNTDTSAVAINNCGQVVVMTTGRSQPAPRSYLYDGTAMTDIGSLGGKYTQAAASDINDLGQIVGVASPLFLDSSAPPRGFLYDGTAMIALGDLVRPNGINNLGQIVGDWEVQESTKHAFLYSDSQLSDLNDLLDPSSAGWTLLSATAINNRGQIAGVGTDPDGRHCAFLATPNAVPEPSASALVLAGAIGASALASRRWRHARARRD